MNKVFGTIAIIAAIGGVAYAADVAARQSCDEIMAEINMLSDATDLSDADAARLGSLRGQYRRSCVKSAGNRVASRAGAVTPTAVSANDDAPAPTVLETARALRQQGCQTILDGIEKLKSDPTPDTAQIAELQAQYDADCTEKPAATAAAPEIDPERIAELIGAGFCADGTKPNRYGCCTGEKFTDLGNLVFACCPSDGGECFPPMN